MNAFHDADPRIAAFLEEGTEVLPDWVLDRVRDQVDATPQRRSRWQTWSAVIMSDAWRFGFVGLLVVLGVGLALVTRPNIGSKPSPQPSPATWTGGFTSVWLGSVRADAAGMPVVLLSEDDEMGGSGWTWADGRDAAVPWVDIGAVRWQLEGQDNWSFDLGGWPPRAEELDPDETIIEYGMVLDTNGDRVADYEVGINNNAPEAGNFRVWVTDLSTGDTHDVTRGPYGYPVEFSHPDEQDPNDTLNGQPRQPSMLFTFLPGSRPIGNVEVLPSDEWRFYVWASVIERGEVVAWDYGPDFGWLTVPSR